MQETSTVAATDVLRAAALLAGTVRLTPLDRSHPLSARAGAEIRLKLENLQITGSFKLRGAANVLAQLPLAERLAGVIAPTAGNHGLGLAHAGKALGISVRICLPRSADPSKVAMMQASGALIDFFDDIEAARQGALRLAKEEGRSFVSAYDHRQMIAGGGTVGLEILREWPDVEVILVPVGGGGLVAGIATIARALNPSVEIWGVQSAASPTFVRWKECGQTGPVDIATSIAEGISGFIEPSTMTWPLVRDRVDRALSVCESEIRCAMKSMLEYERHVVEPSAAAAVAASLRYAKDLRGRRTAVVVTGRNIAADRYLRLINERVTQS